MERRSRATERISRVEEPLAAALRRVDPERRIAAYGLWRFWDEVVGEQIARRAQPRRLRDGVLFVAVSSHAWMQELQFLKDGIRERLNARLGAPLVRDLHLVSGTIRAPETPAEPPPSLVVAVPELPSTDSPELDEALRGLGQAMARRRARGTERPKRRSRGRTK